MKHGHRHVIKIQSEQKDNNSKNSQDSGAAGQSNEKYFNKYFNIIMFILNKILIFFYQISKFNYTNISL